MTSAAPSTPSVSGHVLLVDDEPAYQRLGASFLRQLGYRVSVAGDVDSALQAFADDRPHVVLLDLAMPPSMDPQAGLSLIPHFAQSVIVVLSGHGERDIALQAVERGVWDFLTKPIDPDVLRLVLTRAMHKARLDEQVRALRSAASPPSKGLSPSPLPSCGSWDVSPAPVPTTGACSLAAPLIEFSICVFSSLNCCCRLSIAASADLALKA